MPLVQDRCLAWRLAAELGWELIRIPNGKHFTPEDHPETIALAVNSLLSTA